MATDLEAPPTNAKFEVFVESELVRARRRIRALDAARSLLLLAIVTLGYFLLMAAFDLVFKGTESTGIAAVRLSLFALYVLAALFFVAQLAARLYRQINPYYAAKQLEETLPQAKNSIINWLDLRGRNLPAAIRTALGLRAARDLKQTDAEKAIDPKTNWLLASILAGLILGVLILFALGPRQFGSLFTRAFAPFGGTDLEKRTEITLLKPAGDVTVLVNQPVQFQVQIEGRFSKGNQPGAPRVLYRYSQSDSHVAMPLEEALDGNWTATMLADQVQSGFWYKVAAGDAETDEYQITTRSNPQAIKYEISYHYRPYRRLDDVRVTYPNENAGLTPRLVGPAGTEATLLIRTNRKLKAGRLAVETPAGKSDPACEIEPGDGQSLRVKVLLERSGTFRLFFTSTEGEENTDRMPWFIEVFDDSAPNVVLTLPGKDCSLPADGTLQLEGRASDDVGLKSLTLRYRVLDGLKPALAPKMYRPGKSFQFDNGTYPDLIEYKDFLALVQLKTATGENFPLEAGMVLEYWLEAVDNSDFPDAGGNVGRSQPYKVSILPPTGDDKKQKDERKKAEGAGAQHNKKQDDGHATENTKRNEEQAERNKTPAEKKAEDEQRKKALENLKNEVDPKTKELEKRLQQDEPKNEKPGEAKPDDAKAESKPGDKLNEKPAEAKDQKPASPEQAGEKKDDGKMGQGQNAGETKDNGPMDGAKDRPGEARGAENSDPAPQAKGADDKKAGTNNAQDKGAPKENQSKEQPGQAKAEGNKSDDKSGQSKNEGPKAGEEGAQAKGQKTGSDAPQAQAKDDKSNGNGQNPGSQAAAKDGPKDQLAQGKASSQKQPDAGKGKDAGNADRDANDTTAAAKGSGNNQGRAETKEGPASGQGEPQASAKSQSDKAGTPGNAKDAIPDDAKNSGLAKDDANLKGKKSDREPTAEDIAELMKNLKREEQADDAMQDLARLAREAKDPAVRKAAEEALEKSGRPIPSAPAKEKDSGVAKENAPGMQKEGEKSPMATKEGPPGQTKDGIPQQSESSAKGDERSKSQQARSEPKTGGKYSSFGRDRSDTEENFGTDPNKEFARRGSVLQLENLKKHITPDKLREIGWTKEQFQQYLKDREAYEAMLARQQALAGKNITEVKGGVSNLPGQRPREVKHDPNARIDPVQAGAGVPPPEFREAQRLFTNRPSKAP